jgi:hemolysin activation/secretion protein
LDAKGFEDRFDAVALLTEKEVHMATLSISGDQRDLWGGGGLNRYALAWSTGQLNIQSAAALSKDAENAQTQGHFDKLTWAVSRAQFISPTLTWLASLQGQVTSQNLDASEKMALGGLHGVRAYPEGEAYADDAVVLSLEVRKQLSLPDRAIGQVHLAAFVDAGVGKLNHQPLAAGDKFRHLSGAGLGLYWTRARDFSIQAFYARKIGSEAVLSAPDKSGRFGIQAVKYF